jgi:hypothetical protein
MISPVLGSDLGTAGEDESVVDVCEPLRIDQCSRIRQVTDNGPLPGRIPSGIGPEIIPLDAHPLASHRNDELRPNSLIRPHDRLRC